jgi:DNA-binding response OmpR family regulator
MGRGRILVVDDDPAVRLFTCVCLQTEGFDVVEARCGEEALDAARRETGLDLVVLDNPMPGMSGTEVAKRLRDDPKAAALPILMLSAMSSDHDQWDGWRAGVDLYLTKPFEGEDLVAQVMRLITSSSR